jgi:hypothetical protein
MQLDRPPTHRAPGIDFWAVESALKTGAVSMPVLALLARVQPRRGDALGDG